MPRVAFREWTEFETPDGNTYNFHVPSNVGKWVISNSGWGTPPIEYVTQRGPQQHGETVKAIWLRPRVIQLFIRQEHCNRVDYWAGRADLLDNIRVNRQAVAGGTDPGVLRRILPDGSIRALNVYIVQGPRFEPSRIGIWDEFAFQEMLRWIAYDPVIFDPTRVDVLWDGLAAQTELVFPITFPITFGTSTFNETQNINYVGTWQSLPVIILTGPLLNPTITNTATGEVLDFRYSIPAGDSVTFDLSEGVKSVVDNNGVNLIGSVTPESDIGTFHIAPDPEAAAGLNPIVITGGLADVNSDAELRYFTRYFGI